MGLSVCVSVCLSGKPHLTTSGASVHPETDVTYSTGNEGKKFVGYSFVVEIQQSLRRTAYVRLSIFPVHVLTNEARQLACVCELTSKHGGNYANHRLWLNWQAKDNL